MGFLTNSRNRVREYTLDPFKYINLDFLVQYHANKSWSPELLWFSSENNDKYRYLCIAYKYVRADTCLARFLFTDLGWHGQRRHTSI